MNDEEYKHYVYTAYMGDNLSALTSEELYGLIELYLPQLEVGSDKLSPKKKVVNHKFKMTK
jgi:hypothetical protein